MPLSMPLILRKQWTERYEIRGLHRDRVVLWPGLWQCLRNATHSLEPGKIHSENKLEC